MPPASHYPDYSRSDYSAPDYSGSDYSAPDYSGSDYSAPDYSAAAPGDTSPGGPGGSAGPGEPVGPHGATGVGAAPESGPQQAGGRPDASAESGMPYPPPGAAPSGAAPPGYHDVAVGQVEQGHAAPADPMAAYPGPSGPPPGPPPGAAPSAASPAPSAPPSSPAASPGAAAPPSTPPAAAPETASNLPAGPPTGAPPGAEAASSGATGSADADGSTGTWVAVVTADRSYYDSVIEEGGADPNEVPFPPFCPERRFTLTGDQVRVGRRSAARNLTPEIDLSEAPADPGVSHLHAVLLSRPGGGWVLVDPGSTNGTIVNGSPPIPTNVEIPVQPGDRLHIGAWTAITLRKE